jgi:hypothetical protein
MSDCKSDARLFFVQFPVRHHYQSTHILEIVDKFIFWEAVKFGKHYQCPTEEGIGYEIGQKIGGNYVLRDDAQFSCWTENRTTIRFA